MVNVLFGGGGGCWIALGVVMVMVAASVASAQTTQETDAQQYDLSLAKGVIQFDDGRYEEAEPLFRKALEAKPDGPEASACAGQFSLQLAFPPFLPAPIE